MPALQRSAVIESRSKSDADYENCSCRKISRWRILRFVQRFQSNDRTCNCRRIRIGRWCSRDKFEVESGKFRSDYQTAGACTACGPTSTNRRLPQKWWRVRAAGTNAKSRNLWRYLVVRSTTKSIDSTWLNNSHRDFRQV